MGENYPWIWTLRLQIHFAVFAEDFPARSCVQVAKLPANAKVEIEVIAIAGEIETVREGTSD